jgi:hypothetical protein
MGLASLGLRRQRKQQRHPRQTPPLKAALHVVGVLILDFRFVMRTCASLIGCQYFISFGRGAKIVAG